jgi:hypothetical protein
VVLLSQKCETDEKLFLKTAIFLYSLFQVKRGEAAFVPKKGIHFDMQICAPSLNENCTGLVIENFYLQLGCT